MKRIKKRSEDYEDYIPPAKKGLKSNSENHEVKKYELEQFSFSSHYNKNEVRRKRIVRTNDFIAPKASRKEIEKLGLLSRPNDRIRASNNFYSKNGTIHSFRKR